jgi:hypothetical protein
MVMARLERIRRIVRVRRSQRRESGNEITVGMEMEEALMCRTLFMVYLLVFEDAVASFVIYMTGPSGMGIHLRAFKRFTTHLRSGYDRH